MYYFWDVEEDGVVDSVHVSPLTSQLTVSALEGGGRRGEEEGGEGREGEEGRERGERGRRGEGEEGRRGERGRRGDGEKKEEKGN